MGAGPRPGPVKGRSGGGWTTPLLLLAVSGGLLLVCSGTSPLYRGHDWTDANTYLTMGRGLLQGAVPYRDLFDHKGPLLYLLYALGAVLHPAGFYGVFVLQMLALAGTLYALYRTARCLGAAPAAALVCACALPVFLLSAGIYYLPDQLDYGGGSAEEFCLPLMAGGLWLWAVGERRGGWSPGGLAGLGVLAGAVFQIKFSLAVFFAGLLLPGGIQPPSRRAGRRLLGLGWCALGFVGSLVPYLLYAGVTHSLGNFVRAYFWFNASYARAAAPSLGALIGRAVSAAWSTVLTTPMLVAALLLFGAGLGILARDGTLCLGPLAAFAAVGAAIFAGRVMPYTLLPLLLSSFFGLVALCQRLPAPPSRRWTAVLLAGLGLAAVWGNQMALSRPFAWRAAPTCQEQMAGRIRSGPWEHPTLLEAGMLSRGFYNQLGLVPEIYYFYVPNVTDEEHPEIVEGQLQAILAQEPDYVILQSRQPLLSPESPPQEERLRRLYEAVLQGYKFVDSIPGTGAVDHLTYHLFQRSTP